jgi:hypothetical protein
LHGALTASANVNRAQGAINHELRFVDVGIEYAVLFWGASRPSNTVLVSNIAAEHLGLAADITLSHEAVPPGLKTVDKLLKV